MVTLGGTTYIGAFLLFVMLPKVTKVSKEGHDSFLWEGDIADVIALNFGNVSTA